MPRHRKESSQAAREADHQSPEKSEKRKWMLDGGKAGRKLKSLCGVVGELSCLPRVLLKVEIRVSSD